jgi:hypothetical protein
VHQWYRAAFASAEPETVGDQSVAYDDVKQDAIIVCSGRKVTVGIGPSLGPARAVVGVEK